MEAFVLASAVTERHASEKPVEIIEMHPAEETDRREALKLKISGFEISSEFEPSQEVVHR